MTIKYTRIENIKYLLDRTYKREKREWHTSNFNTSEFAVFMNYSDGYDTLVVRQGNKIVPLK